MRLLRELGRESEAQAEQAAHERLARLDDLGLPADTAPLERRLALARAWIADGELQLAETELRALLTASYHPSAVETLRALLKDDGREARAELEALERDHPHLAGKLLEP